MIAERDPSLRPVALPPDGLVSDKDADIGNAIGLVDRGGDGAYELIPGIDFSENICAIHNVLDLALFIVFFMPLL